jgi:hypothetical protein
VQYQYNIGDCVAVGGNWLSARWRGRGTVVRVQHGSRPDGLDARYLIEYEDGRASSWFPPGDLTRVVSDKR